MPLRTPLEQRIQEFQDAINLAEYNGVVAKLIKEVDCLPINSFSLDYRPDAVSRHETSPEGYRIWIRFKHKLGFSKVLFFDMLHELGHFHDPEKLPSDQQDNIALRRGREQRAWSWADAEFLKHPELQADLELYRDYQRRSLAFYGIR